MKKIISLILVSAILCSITAFGHPFKDASGHWADSEIEKAYTNKVINGDPDGRFRPDDAITRAEFLKMLTENICNRMGITIPEDFAETTHWASKNYTFATLYLYKILEEEVDGIKAGQMETAEELDTPITRWEMAYILSESVKNAVNIHSDEKDLPFKDGDKIGNDYPDAVKAAIANCYGLGLMKGDEKNLFNPKETGTRAEAVTVINRVDGIIENLINAYNSSVEQQMNEYNSKIEASQVTYDKIPEGHPVVTMLMSNNKKIMIELYPEYAPQTVANFVKLIKDGFYDGLTFHRIIPGFVAQGGDPSGDGTGGSEGCIKGEFLANGVETNSLSHTRGVISMARSQHFDSASSQFFICLDDASSLDGQYAAFGKVITGMNVLDDFAKGELLMSASGEMSTPAKPVVIKKMTVSVK